MKCADCEQLIDAYLDGELSGSLRLEFDAHRLRCRRCQLTVAMMESVEHVVTSDRPAPVLSDDFTDRVMGVIEQRQPLSRRLRPMRVAVVAGAVLQAAAVLILAIMLPTRPPLAGTGADPASAINATPVAAAALASDELAALDIQTDKHEILYEYIFGRVQDVASELNQLAQYPLALPVSEDFARASQGAGEVNPWNMFLRALVPVEAEEADTPTPSFTNQHSL